MNLGCQNCIDKDNCSVSKRFCKHCETYHLEAVGQFSHGSIVNRTVVFSCYNEDCDYFGQLVDIHCSPVNMEDMLLEKVVA